MGAKDNLISHVHEITVGWVKNKYKPEMMALSSINEPKEWRVSIAQLWRTAFAYWSVILLGFMVKLNYLTPLS